MPQQTQWFFFLIFFSLFSIAPLMAAEETQTHLFLEQHWPTGGIPLQGNPPNDFSSIEASLNPQQCRLCHPQQFKDWKKSRHAQAMGAGILGQMPSLLKNDPESARECFRCHTPLAEQQDLLQNKQGHWQKNKQFDAELQHQGLVCAGCHVRQWQRFGPPRKNMPDKIGTIGKGKLPHNGFTANKAFQSSEFCKSCHQFDETGYALNGKPLENTFQEWSDSKYAKQGISCQNCHMPGRRHLWRGIHDKNMVKEGLEINTALEQEIYAPGDTLTASITVNNTGVGHHFPTYITPKVFIRAYLLTAQGKVLEGSRQEAVIGRALSPDMMAESYDTRIPAGDSLTIQYQRLITEPNMTLRVEIEVAPDHFYEKFFQNMAPQSGELLHEALQKTQQSSYRLYDRSIPLGHAPAATAKQALTLNHNPNQPIAVDWNEENLTWYAYDKALQLAKQTNRPILFLLYADWCPTCHAYSSIFHDVGIVKATKNVILSRANVDLRPELSQQFNLDGEYVPRTYLLDQNGRIIEQAYGKKEFPRYFLNAEATEGFLTLLNRAK